MTPRFPRDPIPLAPLGRALLAAADEVERACAQRTGRPPTGCPVIAHPPLHPPTAVPQGGGP